MEGKHNMNLTDEQSGLLMTLMDRLFDEQPLTVEFREMFGTDEIEALWDIRSELMEDL